jgi:hypothetical protein
METAACAGTSGERSISRMEVIRKSQDPQSTEKKCLANLFNRIIQSDAIRGK